jgi:glycosyltransferase involved in cell wall biosynthesis
MKITVITPVFNGEETIRTCIESVLNQACFDKEYIIVDGGSSDKTVPILKGYPTKALTWISEKDKGLYDAFNKGIIMATGDVVCFLCADDMYAHSNVLQKIVDTFSSNPGTDMVYGDILYVDRYDLSKIKRYWKSSPFKPGLFKKGWLPPNTALFIRRSVFLQHGLFSLQYKMAGDYEMQYRFFEKLRKKSLYISDIMVRMRNGGMSNSSLSGIYTSLKECYDALKYHKVKYPLLYILNTVFYRFKQIFIPSNIKNNYNQKND